MRGMGYTNPIRGMERRLSPNFAQREMSDPGLRGLHVGTSGLGSLHTMPHLRPSVPRLQDGGMNPMGDDGAASGPQDLMEPEDQQSEGDGDEREIVLEAMAALEGQAEDPEEALAHFIDTFGPAALKDLQQMVEQKHQQSDDRGEGDEDDQEQPGGDGDDDQDAMLQQMDPEQDELAAAGGGLLNGPGTGQSDDIEATTPSGRPVLLSDGEYVIDAATVAALGDGSTNAGARRLDELRKQIRQGAYGHDKQAKPMKKGGSTGLVLRIP